MKLNFSEIYKINNCNQRRIGNKKISALLTGIGKKNVAPKTLLFTTMFQFVH